MDGGRGLDDDPGAGRGLAEFRHPGHGLERPLAHAVVGKAEKRLRREDADEPDTGHPGLVGQELGRDQYGEPPLGKIAKDPFPFLPSWRRVGVEARHRGAGEQGLELLLQRLGPGPAPEDEAAAAGRAAGPGSQRGAAIMADECLVLFVVDERDVAAPAARHAAAGRARQGGGVAAPVEEKDDRLVALQAGRDPEPELPREKRGVGPVVDPRDGCALRRPAELDQRARPRGRLMGLHGRPGRAEDDDRALGQPPEPGAAPGVIGGAFGLNIGLLMLVVDDDEGQRARREEERGAGPRDQGRAAAPEAPPGGFLLLLGHPAMEDRGRPAEFRLEAIGELPGQGDLRDEEERPPGPAQRPSDEVPVGGRERRPGAVEAERPEPPRFDRRLDRRQCPRRRAAGAEVERKLPWAGPGAGLRGTRRPGRRLAHLEELLRLHPGEERSHILQSSPSLQKERAPPPGLSEEERGQGLFPGPESLPLEGRPAGLRQDDRHFFFEGQGRRQGGLEDLPPGRMELGAEGPGEGQETRVPERIFVQDLGDLLELEPLGGRFGARGDDEPYLVLSAERSADTASRPDLVIEAVRDGIEEGLAERQGKDDADVGAHFLPRRDITFCMSSQTMRRSSRFPSFLMR